MRKSITEITSVLFIILFVYTAASKLIDFQNFKAVIGQSPLLTNFAGFLAVAVPASEIIIAVMLASQKYRLRGLYASFAMMILFTTYIVILMTLAEKVPCSCGGVISMMSWEQHLYFNLFFVALAFIGIALQTKQQEISNSTLNASNSLYH